MSTIIEEISEQINNEANRFEFDNYIELGKCLYSILYNFAYNYNDYTYDYFVSPRVRVSLIDDEKAKSFSFIASTDRETISLTGKETPGKHLPSRSLYTEAIITTPGKYSSSVMCNMRIVNISAKDIGTAAEKGLTPVQLFIIHSPDQADKPSRKGIVFLKNFILAVYINLHQIYVDDKLNFRAINQFINNDDMMYFCMSAARNVFTTIQGKKFSNELDLPGGVTASFPQSCSTIVNQINVVKTV